jgi:plasmid stabilization system protein ParE
MPKAWSAKRERQYEHIKDSYEESGVAEEEAQERAARTVNKQRTESGETRGARSRGEDGARKKRS